MLTCQRSFGWIAGLAIVLMAAHASGAEATSDKAGCSDDVYKLLERDLKTPALTARRNDGNIVAEACKLWPYNTKLKLAAVAYDAGVEYEKQLVVAVIDTARGRVISSHKNVIVEDAMTGVGAHSLVLDTARYQLASGVRGFGFIFRSSAIGASCADGHMGDELTLLVPQGRKLRPVLNLYMYRQHALQGCLSVQSPNAVWLDASLTIGVENTSTNGFRDLSVKALIATVSNTETAHPDKDRSEHHLLRYNGTSYESGEKKPWWLGF